MSEIQQCWRAVTHLSVALTLLLSTAVAHAQQREIRIRAARVLDGTGRVLENATVVVKGSSITAIEPSNSKPVDIDLGQSTLLPGLIDVHAHIGWHFGPNGRYEPRAQTQAQDILYAAENAYLTLMAGVHNRSESWTTRRCGFARGDRARRSSRPANPDVDRADHPEQRNAGRASPESSRVEKAGR